MQDDRLLSLGYWKELVSRRRWLILACAMLVITAAGAFSLTRAPEYESICTLMLNRQRVEAMNLQDIYTKQQTGRPADIVLAQVEILRSKGILEKAIHDLESRGLLRFGDDVAGEVPSWPRRILVAAHVLRAESTRTADEKREHYVQRLRQRIEVFNTGGNAFLSVAVKAQNPQLAAEIANAITAAYIHNDREMLRHSADEAVAWLSDRLREQRDSLVAAEDSLRAYSGPAGRDEDLSPLAIQEMARFQQALLDVRLMLLQSETVGAGGSEGGDASDAAGGGDTVDGEVNAALREKVRRELVDTVASLSQLRRKLGESHPDVIMAAEKESQLRAEMLRLDAIAPRPSSSIGGGARRLRPQDLEALRAQEKLLQQQIDSSLKLNATKGEAATRYTILKREVEINRSLYNEMLTRLNEITISSGLDPVTAEVFERAIPSERPSSPDHPKTLLIGLVLGLCLGLVVAAVGDHLDESLRDPTQANDLLKAPVLAIIPDHLKLPDRVPRKGASRLYVGAGEESISAEAYRVLRSHIEGTIPSAESAILLMTSAVAGEGKSMTASNLAAAFAESGRKVLLIDADFRRPSLGKIFTLRDGSCVGKVLRGEASPEASVQPSGVPGLDFLGFAGGQVPKGRPATEAFQRLFEWSRKAYDHIIVDMPILMVAPGVTEVARAGASVILVHRPGWVQAQVLNQVREHLALARTRLLGVVLNGAGQRWSTSRYLPVYYYAGYRTQPPS